uniref:tRNA wybutosine-synthesizing protein domain-containing protein n=1 Tax=candidate division CPR3 bacterium TaxID=2268181 RepID=A0A7C4M2W0_UNCC3
MIVILIKERRRLLILLKGKKGGSVYGYGENKGKLDDNIRDLVNKLNKLPFLFTRESCGGRISTRESIKEESKEIMKFHGLGE